MAQPNSGDWPIDPTNTTGNDLADKLNRLTAAIYSTFAGTGRPSGSTTGMIWVQTSGTELRVNLWNGTTNVRIATGSTSANTIAYNAVYTKTEVDNMITALQGQVNAVASVPAGLIAMWSGTNAAIPSGWSLCDGSGGTPNLRDRFIVGSGSSYTTGNTGGSNSITEVPSHVHSYSGSTSTTGNHTHTATMNINTAGSHTHAYDGARGGSADGLPQQGFSGGDDFDTPNMSGRIKSAGSHSHTGTVTLSNAGSHSHNYNGTTNASGRSSVDIRPLYYALAYIMKV